MGKALRTGIYILAAYVGCRYVEEKTKKSKEKFYDEVLPEKKRKIMGAIEKVLYGDYMYYNPKRSHSHHSYASKRRYGPHIDYSLIYSDVENYPFDADKINDVFIRLQDYIDEYGIITIKAVLNEIGVCDTRYIDTQYGWHDISGWDVRIERAASIGNTFSAYLITDEKPEII